MANLLVGPLLRYIGSTQATVWVETDAPCEVDGARRTGSGRSTSRATTTRSSCSTTSSRRPRTPYEVRLDGRAVWPPDDGRPPSDDPHARATSARRGSSSARAGSARRSELPYTLSPLRAPEGVRDRRALGVLARLQAGSGSRGPTACCCSATRCTPTRSRPRPSQFIRVAARRVAAARRAGRRLRGVHAALPRVVERPRHPLAARDGAEHDDLRRPRRARRLEHLGGLGRRDARHCRGGTSASSARSCRTGSTSTSATSPRRSSAEERAATPSSRADEDGGPRLRAFAHMADRESAASRWAFHRDFGALAPRRRRLARGAGARRRPARHGRRGGVGLDRRARARRLRPPDHREHAARVHDGRHPRARGVERGRLRRAPGDASRRGRPRSCAARSTSSTGRPSSARSRTMVELLRRARGGAGGAVGTITLIGGDVHTAYDRRGRRRRARSGAASSRSSARRSATRCRRRSGGSSA